MEDTTTDLATLAAEITQLRAEVATLQDRLAQEVRTHRLVVVDEAGHDRVVIAGQPTAGSVQVRSNHGSTTGVELYALDDGGNGRAEAGLVFLRAGDVVGVWRSE